MSGVRVVDVLDNVRNFCERYKRSKTKGEKKKLCKNKMLAKVNYCIKSDYSWLKYGFSDY